MKYYSVDDISEMKTNGYESKTIKEAQNINLPADILISKIIETFKDVKLKGGVGLNEAQGLDDYADKETLIELNRKDEKDNWQKIPSKELNRCHSSLSFFDQNGMRFHLPAYMIVDIKDEYDFDMAFHLIDLSNYSREQLSALLPKEKKVISLFLEYIYDKEEYRYNKSEIQKSLETYWHL